MIISASKPQLNQVTARYGKPTRGPAPDTVRLTSPEDRQSQVEESLSNLMAGKNSGAVQFADSHGRVKHLALMLSEYVEDEARKQVLNGYSLLFKHMEPDTKFTIAVAADKDREDIQKMMNENHIEDQGRIQILQPGVPNLTVWARDMMVPQFKPGDADHTALEAQEPLHNWHGDDSQIPQYITQANPSIELHNNKGIVTDGGVRDFAAVQQFDIPVFSQGAHPSVLGRRHVPWEVDVTIACGGAAVQPGDVIMGDRDGVIVIPPFLLEEVAREAAEQEQADAWVAEQVANGAPVDGLFPMNAEWRAKYEASRAANPIDAAEAAKAADSAQDRA